MASNYSTCAVSSRGTIVLLKTDYLIVKNTKYSNQAVHLLKVAWTTSYNYLLVMRATYDMLDLKTKCCPRPRATFCLKVQHIICCPNLQSIIVLLYLHWFRIKYSIQTIHKQTDHDQTGLNLDELIWDELALV